MCVQVVGCSTSKLHNNIVDVRAEEPILKTAVLEEKSEYNDDFEDVSYSAYNHYIQGIFLESEDPPDIPAAAEHYKRALQYHPNSHQLIYSLANTYMSMRMFPETVELLERIKPADKKVLMMLGIGYLQTRKQDSAKHVYEKLAQVAPNEPTSYHYLSSFYTNSNNKDSLMWAYENLSRLLPFNHMYWLELGKLKAEKGEFKEAKINFQKSLEKNSSKSNILSYVGLAEMYKIEHQMDSVLITYKRALEVDSTNAALNTDVAMMYAQLDSLEKAIPYASKAVQYNPDDLMGLRRLGIIYFGTQKFDSAETVFTEMVNRGDRDYLNHFYLGRIAAQREDYNIAIDEFKIMVQLNDSMPEHWMDLGYAYKKIGDVPHEILAYKTGVSKTPDRDGQTKLLFSLGNAYEQNDMFDSAFVTFEKLLELSPDHHQTMNYLGYLLAEKGVQLKYAKKLIEKALKLDPNNAAYLDSYGWVYFKLSENKKAVKYLKKAAELQNDYVIYQHLGDAYNAKGDSEKAVEWWTKALELSPDNKEIKNKLKK